MDKVKAVFIAIWSFICSVFGALAIPVVLLALANIIDYVTAIFAAPNRNQKVDSNKGWTGIKKKVCMWLLVIVGGVVDILLKYASTTVGITLPFSFAIACIVSIWLIANELLSILENVNDIGVNLPPFLKPLIKYIKNQSENKASFVDDNEVKKNE